ncbi:MAG: hypothetical protein JSS09_09790 [Verrucomicrobia bacterium]|nr:hypothetical protein [Verrucomicrobiota bacterium]
MSIPRSTSPFYSRLLRGEDDPKDLSWSALAFQFERDLMTVLPLEEKIKIINTLERQISRVPLFEGVPVLRSQGFLDKMAGSICVQFADEDFQRTVKKELGVDFDKIGKAAGRALARINSIPKTPL